MRWAERLIPNLSILCRNVFGCIPRVFAAPLAPSITPRVCSSTAKMWARSTSWRVGTIEGDGALGCVSVGGS